MREQETRGSGRARSGWWCCYRPIGRKPSGYRRPIFSPHSSRPARLHRTNQSRTWRILIDAALPFVCAEKWRAVLPKCETYFVRHRQLYSRYCLPIKHCKTRELPITFLPVSLPRTSFYFTSSCMPGKPSDNISHLLPGCLPPTFNYHSQVLLSHLKIPHEDFRKAIMNLDTRALQVEFHCFLRSF